jgi:hypothetical protein
MGQAQSYNGAGAIAAKAILKQWWFVEKATTDCGKHEKMRASWPDGQRRFFVKKRRDELHIQK